MVASLLVVAFIGPEIAPHNPYVRQRIQYVDGVIQRAPIEPGAIYPLGTDEWGRDVLSLLLHGARTTLVIALIAIAIRLLLGLLLGGASGWWPGGLVDQVSGGAIALVSAFPALILAILVVFAVGIRRGQVPFVVALSVVGWGEVAQIVRSQVYSLRKEMFIESARAIGLSPLQILSRHVLPNLLPTLIALTSLQIAGALLLLGELGFVRVFLGSGTTIAGDAATASQIIFETPDWGAMLGSTWRFFRVHPWLPAAPALAFFVSILSFNLLGYGLQRFADRGKFYPSGWPVARFGIVAISILFVVQFVLARTGPEIAFRSKTQSFDISRVMSDVAILASPELEGRVPGSNGRDLAALYIAREFSEMDLTPFPHGNYFQVYPTTFGRITQPPVLEVLDDYGGQVLRISDGVRFDPLFPFDASGTFEGDLVIRGSNSSNAVFFPGAERVGLYLLIHTPERVEDPSTLGGRFSEFVPLVVTPDEEMPDSSMPPRFLGPRAFLSTSPYLMISETAAAKLLRESGFDLEEIQAQLGQGISTWETRVRLRLEVGLEYETVEALNVVGYIPGSDIRVQNQRIVVVAPYTGPAPQEGRYFPGADENASGAAIMLEVLRLWRDEGFVPERTVAFAAVDANGAEHFMLNPILPTRSSDSWTSVEIFGLGAGDEKVARLQAGAGLQELFDKSARTMSVGTQQLNQWGFFFRGGGGRGWSVAADPSFSGIAVTRPGNKNSGTLIDDVSNIDPELLQEAGKVLGHFLMVISSQ